MNKDFQKYSEVFNKIKNEIKTERKSDEKKYCWVVDTSHDERKRKSDTINKKGSSMYLHYWPFNLSKSNECNLIDTPGFDAYTRERIKGIFWGDIGIFVAECNDLTKDVFDDPENSIRDFLNPLILWSKMGSKKTLRLIVILSKMDRISFSEEVYEKAKNKIEKICKGINLTNIQIIPSCINVHDEVDHNIINKSPSMVWYQGPTLLEAMETQLNNIKKTKVIKKQLLLTLDSKTYNIKGIGDVVTGKILSGMIGIQDNVRIVPIERDGQIESLKGKVKSIKITHGQIAEVAEEGSHIGISLSDLTVNQKRVEISNCSLFRTSLLIHEEVKVRTGNFFKLKIFDQDVRVFHFLESLNIIWQGRSVPARVIFIKEIVNEIGICLETDIAAIPLTGDNHFCFTNFILKVNPESTVKENDETDSKDSHEIVRTTILDMGFVDELEFALAEPVDKTENLIKYFTNFPSKIDNDKIRFHDLHSSKCTFKNILQVKRFEDKKCEGASPILQSIEVKLKYNTI